MDFTGAQMVLTLKLISVAVSYQDGLKKEEVHISLQQMLLRPWLSPLSQGRRDLQSPA